MWNTISDATPSAGLKTLVLRANFGPDPPLPLRPRFKLASLELGFDADSARVVLGILTASASTLTSLIINSIHWNVLPSIGQFFAHSAGILQQLTIGASEAELLLPHASSLTSLEYISVCAETKEGLEHVDAFLRGLPSPIEGLDVLVEDEPLEGHSDRLAQIGILSDKVEEPSWAGLIRLYLLKAKREDIVALPLGELLVKRCEEKGIKVVYC